MTKLVTASAHSLVSTSVLPFCFCDKTPHQMFNLGLKSFRGLAYDGGTKACQPQQQKACILICKLEAERGHTGNIRTALKPTVNDRPPPTRPRLLISFPNNSTNWGPNIQTDERAYGVILIQATILRLPPYIR